MKKYFVFFLFICITIFLVSAAVVYSNTIPDYISIKSEEDLFSISNNLDADYRLEADIKLTKPWKPLGNTKEPFKGIFNGNGHYISNLEFVNIGYEEENSNYYGLFVKNSGTIIGLNLIEPKLQYQNDLKLNYVIFGLFASINEGYISSSQIILTNETGNISFNTNKLIFGWFSGINDKQIKNCFLKNNIFISNEADNLLFGIFSGLAGKNSKIEYCSNVSYVSFRNLRQNANLYLGVLYGECNGGFVINCNISSTFIRERGEFINELIIGGVSGIKSSYNNVAIENSNLNYSFSNDYENCSVLYAAKMFGYIKEESFITLKNVLLYNSIQLLKPTFKFGAICSNMIINNIEIINSFCVDQNINVLNYIVDTIPRAQISELTVELLQWDNRVWKIEDGRIYYLL